MIAQCLSICNQSVTGKWTGKLIVVSLMHVLMTVKSFNTAFGGEKWKTNVLLTSFLCPG